MDIIVICKSSNYYLDIIKIIKKLSWKSFKVSQYYPFKKIVTYPFKKIVTYPTVEDKNP